MYPSTKRYAITHSSGWTVFVEAITSERAAEIFLLGVIAPMGGGMARTWDGDEVVRVVSGHSEWTITEA